MTATVKTVGPKPLLERTRAYHYKEPMPAGLNDYRLKWRVKPLEQPKKAKAKAKAAAKPKPKPKAVPKPKLEKQPVAKKRKYRQWTIRERNDIVQRHDNGEAYATIADDYGATIAQVRSTYRRAIGDK